MNRWPRNYPANISTMYSCALTMYYSLQRLGVEPLGRDKCPDWPGITCLVLGAGELEGNCPDRTMAAFAPLFSLVAKRWPTRQCPVINLILVGQESRYPKTCVPFRVDMQSNNDLLAPGHVNDSEVVDINVCACMC